MINHDESLLKAIGALLFSHFKRPWGMCRGPFRGRPELRDFCDCLAGRSCALAEMGRPRARLEAQEKVLQAALADARAAVALAQRLGKGDGDLLVKVVVASKGRSMS